MQQEVARFELRSISDRIKNTFDLGLNKSIAVVYRGGMVSLVQFECDKYGFPNSGIVFTEDYMSKHEGRTYISRTAISLVEPLDVIELWDLDEGCPYKKVITWEGVIVGREDTALNDTKTIDLQKLVTEFLNKRGEDTLRKANDIKGVKDLI